MPKEARVKNNKDHKVVARRIIDEVWSKGNVDVLDETMTPDCVIHEHGEDVGHGPDWAKDRVQMMRQGFPDLRFTVEELITQGDKVVVRWTAHGTHRGELMGVPPTNKPGNVTGISIQRFEGDKVAEVWTDWDRLGMMEQIGAIQQPAGAR